MRKVTKKMFTLSLIVGMCVCGASLLHERRIVESHAYAGISYYASKKMNLSPEKALALNVIGIWESTLQGAAWGAAFGPAGAAFGMGVAAL